MLWSQLDKDGVELAIPLDEPAARPGQTLEVTACWRGKRIGRRFQQSLESSFEVTRS
jgi:hypothetical protein